jgi:hypothetical protein
LGFILEKGYNESCDKFKKGGSMKGARPIYKKLLIAAITVYVIGTAFALADIYHKIGNIDHALGHMAPLCVHDGRGAK